MRTATHLALMALGLYFVVDAAMIVLAHMLVPDPPAMVAPRGKAEPGRQSFQSSRAAQTEILFTRIVERNLFGPAALVGHKEQPPPPPVKREIGLELLGTVVADTDKGLAAVILDRTAKSQDYYHVGQAVRPGMTLKAVQRKSAILATDRGDVLLALAEDDVSLASPAAPASAAETEPPAGYSLSRQSIEDSVQNLGQVMQQANIERISRGSTSGYRVTGIQGGSVFERLNLQNGDIVTGLNGEEIADPNQFMELYNSLAQHDTVTVNLFRRGRKHDLTFTLQ